MIKKLSDKLKYDIFIFLSFFARNMISIYIPIVLYEKGLGIKEIFLYIMLNYLFSIILCIPVIKLGRAIKFKYIMASSAIFLSSAFYFLSLSFSPVITVVILAILMALFSETYWLGRHYYAMEIFSKDKMGVAAGNVIIICLLSSIPSAFIGALLLDNMGLGILTILVAVIMVASTIPLFYIKEKQHRQKPDIKKVLKCIPKTSLGLLSLDQFRYFIAILFPLYIYLNIVSTYTYIGTLNVFSGIAAVIFVYFFSHLMDKKKSDYLNIIIVLLASIFIVKLNVISPSFMVAVVVLETIIANVYSTSVTRDVYALGKCYEPTSYIAVYQISINIVRVLIMAFAILFVNNLTIFLYFSVIIMFFTSLLKFDDGVGGY